MREGRERGKEGRAQEGETGKREHAREIEQRGRAKVREERRGVVKFVATTTQKQKRKRRIGKRNTVSQTGE